MDNSKEPRSGHRAPAGGKNAGPGPETSAAMDAAFSSSVTGASALRGAKALVKGDLNGTGLD